MTDDHDIDALREQTRGSDRIESESGAATMDDARSSATGDEGDADDTSPSPGGATASDVEPTAGFVDEVEEAIGHATSGIGPRTYSGSDPAFGGLFETLRDRPEDARRVAEALAAAADTEVPEEIDKATLIDLAVAAGLRAAAPDYLEPLDDRRR
jgi:hypothetical protein